MPDQPETNAYGLAGMGVACVVLAVMFRAGERLSREVDR